MIEKKALKIHTFPCTHSHPCTQTHKWSNAASILSHILVHAGIFNHVSAITSNTQQLYGSHGSENGWHYSTKLLFMFCTDERQLDSEHGGRTSYMYPMANQMSQDTRHGTQSLRTYYNILEGNSDTECLRSELTAITGRKEK